MASFPASAREALQVCYKVLPPVSCKQHSLVTEFLPLAKKLHLSLGQEFSATPAPGKCSKALGQ